VFGGRARKRVKSNRSWIGSETTNERAFPMERTSTPQPSATAQPTATESECASRHLSSDWQKRWGARRKPGWSPRKGRRFEFLPRRKPCRNTADQAFLPSINLKSAVSCLAGASSVCSSEPRRKLYGSQSGQIIARGDRRWHPGLNDSGFSASFDRRIAESSGLRRLAVPCATK
jgi:hypothetical protein